MGLCSGLEEGFSPGIVMSFLIVEIAKFDSHIVPKFSVEETGLFKCIYLENDNRSVINGSTCSC